MLSPRWRKAVRDVWLHKARTLLVIAAITIGVAGAGAVLDTWSLMRFVTVQEFKASNPASATLRMDSVDAPLLAVVRAMPEINAAVATRTVVGAVRTSTGTFTAAIYVSPDFPGSRIGAVTSESGDWPPKDGDIAIERSSVEYGGIAVGDNVVVRTRDGTEGSLRVSGIVHDVGVAPGWMDHLVYGYMTPSTLTKLGGAARLDELKIVVRENPMDRESNRRVAARVKAIAEQLGHHVLDVNVPQPGTHVHAGQINSLLFTQGAFGLLALFLSALLVVNLITAMLAGQVREIGTMKAVGASARQIIVVYLAVAFVLGLAATIIAVPLAAVIGRQYAMFTSELLNFSVVGVPIPRSAFVLQILVGALLPVLSAAVPVIRGCNISVSDALRDLGISLGSGGVLFDLPRWAKAESLPRSLRYSFRNVLRRRQRTILTLFTLATGGAVYLGASNLRRSVTGSLGQMFDTQHYHMSLRITQPLAPDSLERLVRHTPGVAAAEVLGGARAIVARKDGSVSNAFALNGLPIQSQLVVPNIANGRWLQAGDRRVLVVSRRLMDDEPSLAVGNSVDLTISGKTTTWSVVGMYDSGVEESAFIPMETLLTDAGVAGATTVIVTSADTTQQGQFALVQRIRNDLRDAGIQVQSSNLVAESRSAIEDHLLMVVSFLGVMGQLMIVVGGLGLAATMSISVLERTREIGVLRAIGARHSSIHALVHGEGLMIGLASWLLAIPLSIPMSLALGRAFGKIMFPVPVMIAPEMIGVLRWFVVVVILTIIACAVPAWRAARITPRVALAFE